MKNSNWTWIHSPWTYHHHRNWNEQNLHNNHSTFNFPFLIFNFLSFFLWFPELPNNHFVLSNRFFCFLLKKSVFFLWFKNFQISSPSSINYYPIDWLINQSINWVELMWLFFCCVCSFCLFILFVSHIQPYLMKEFLRAKKNDDDSWWFSLMNIIIIFIIIIIQWFCHLIYSNSDFFSFILLSFFFVQIIQFSVLFNFRIFRVFSVCRRCWLTTTTNQQKSQLIIFTQV